MRQCEIKDIKLYQVRTKIIALGCYWVTMIFFGQINPKIHYSPGMHNVQVKTKKFRTNQLKRPENGPFSVHLWCSFYGYPVFVVTYLSKINCKPIFCIHFRFRLRGLRCCKPFLTSTYPLPGKSKITKKFAVKLVTTKRKHFGVS